MSSAFWQDHDYPRALAQSRIALELLRGTDEADAARLRAAAISVLGGDHQGALDLAREGIRSTLAFNASARSGEGHQTMLPALHQIAGEAEWALKQPAAAAEHLREAVKLARGTFGDEDYVTITMAARLAEFLFVSGQGAEARQILAEAVRRLADRPVNPAADSPFDALAAVGRARQAAGEPAAALTSFSYALALRPDADASPAVAELLRWQTRALLALGRREEAAAALDRGIAMRTRSGLQSGTALLDEAELRTRLAGPE